MVEINNDELVRRAKELLNLWKGWKKEGATLDKAIAFVKKTLKEHVPYGFNLGDHFTPASGDGEMSDEKWD